MVTASVRIDVICSAFNCERYLGELISSLGAQTHSEWRLWIRDDASTDGTARVMEEAARQDTRINMVDRGGERLGAAASFGRVLEQLIATRGAASGYVMTADADDVWLPAKMTRTLAAMLQAESEHLASTPILVHTDLRVVDSDLRPQHPSFWAYAGLDPEPPTLHRLIVRNFVAGPTIMMNAALRDRVGVTPPEALYQDWWYALVAAAIGRVVAVRESTVLYRQHASNSVGAHPRLRARLADVPRIITAGFESAQQFRAGLQKTAGQARAILERYGPELSDEQRRFLRDYALIPKRGFFRRKTEVLRLRVLPEHGVMQAIGAVIRA
jgi:glycosyltransferase involved in cell wall biosynthesis